MYAIGAIATNTAGLTPPPSQVQGHFQYCQLLSNNFLVSMAHHPWQEFCKRVILVDVKFANHTGQNPGL